MYMIGRLDWDRGSQREQGDEEIAGGDGPGRPLPPILLAAGRNGFGAMTSWHGGGQAFIPFRALGPGARRTLDPDSGAAASFGQMSDMSDKDRHRVPGSERMKRRSMLEAGFDRWLNRQLHEIYDPVLNEAVPDEIASLLDQFDPKPDGKDEPPEEG